MQHQTELAVLAETCGWLGYNKTNTAMTAPSASHDDLENIEVLSRCVADREQRYQTAVVREKPNSR